MEYSDAHLEVNLRSDLSIMPPNVGLLRHCLTQSWTPTQRISTSKSQLTLFGS